jgi:hypothetical protein
MGLGLPQFVSKTPPGGRIIGLLFEVFEEMDHSMLSHRDSQHRSHKANLSQFNDRRQALATQNPKPFDGWLSTDVTKRRFSSPSGNKYRKERLAGYYVKISCSDAEIGQNLIITTKMPGLSKLA